MHCLRGTGRVLRRALAVASAACALLVAAAGVAAAPPIVSKDLARIYFGSTLVRAEVVSVLGRGVYRDFRIDEGRVVGVHANAVDLLERDGTRQTIRVGPATQVSGVGRLFGPGAAARGVRIVTVRVGDGPATQIRPSAGLRALGKVFLGTTLVRAEVLSYSGGTVRDYRIDEGRITNVKPAAGTLVLLERDGSKQSIQFGSSTVVTDFFQPVDPSVLTRGMGVVAIRSGDGPAQEIRILPGAPGGRR